MSPFPSLASMLRVGVKIGHDGINVKNSVRVKTGHDRINIQKPSEKKTVFENLR